MERKLIHDADLNIVRDDPDRPGVAVLYDCDGEIYFQFPMVWSDDAIMTAVRFANQAYDRGVAAGRYSKAWEVKKALDSA